MELDYGKVAEDWKIRIVMSSKGLIEKNVNEQ
jgi:hypothetical protein